MLIMPKLWTFLNIALCVAILWAYRVRFGTVARCVRSWPVWVWLGVLVDTIVRAAGGWDSYVGQGLLAWCVLAILQAAILVGLAVLLFLDARWLLRSRG